MTNFDPNDYKWCNPGQHWMLKKDFTHNTRSPDGLDSKCKECRKKYNEKHKNRRNKVEHAKYMRTHNLKKHYNLTPEDYEALFEAQKGECAICGRKDEKKVLRVDHNHDTGWVRGLLCGNCNTALGLFGDSVEVVEKALEYLRRNVEWNRLISPETLLTKETPSMEMPGDSTESSSSV